MLPSIVINITIDGNMNWLAFVYSLPSQANTTRVSAWRRMRRLGAISPTSGLYLLPERDDCLEAWQWLAQEIRQAQGEAALMRVHQIEEISDTELIEMFRQARQVEYEEIAAQLELLEQQVGTLSEGDDKTMLQAALTKIQKQMSDINRIDYFQAPLGAVVAGRINQLSQQLVAVGSANPVVMSVVMAEYQNKKWVTRPRPHVDRLACVWLIRHFINPQAIIRYGPAPEMDEIPFDMNESEFSHQGNLCTFEVMVQAFGLMEPGLQPLAEIIHDIDLRDERYQRSEAAGIDAILQGWLLENVSDEVLEQRGRALFAGLFAMFSHLLSNTR